MHITSPSENAPLLRSIGLALIFAGVSVTGINVVADLGFRPGGIVLFLVGLGVLLALRLGKNLWAAMIICWGGLAINLASALVSQGLLNVSWIALPIACMAAGWFMGRSMAWVIAAVSALSAACFYGLHVYGYPFSSHQPLESILGGLIASFVIAALIASATSQTYWQQYRLISESRAELNAVMDSTQAMIWSVSTDGFALRTFNLEFENEIQKQQGVQALPGMTPAQIFSHALSDTNWTDLYTKAMQTDDLRLEGAFFGEGRVFELALHQIHQGDQLLGISAFAVDITERKKAAEQIERLAYYDGLTGLPNRVLGQDRLRQTIAAMVQRSAGLAVLYLDIDDFRNINNAHGNEVGDGFLRQMAMRIGAALGPQGTLCRLAGDSYMAVVSDVRTADEVIGICQRILTQVRNPLRIEEVQLHPSLCIGVVHLDSEGVKNARADAVMVNADMALHEAKKSGSGSFRFFEGEMNTRIQHYLETRDALRLALKNQEFELQFQPLIHVSTSRVLGAEALIRWNHPEKGRLLPGSFISSAEVSGQIVDITRWVLMQACWAAASWPSVHGQRLSVAVNLSPVHFTSGALLADVQLALDRSRLDPTCLELELTEGLLMERDDEVDQTLTQLRAMGVRIAIDDFGTGYSSMAYLQRFPVDKLKIDRSFIARLEESEGARAIVDAMVSVAHALKVDVLAEGVESASGLRMLHALGCDQAQGFHISQPLTTDEFVRWVEAFVQKPPADLLSQG